MYPLCLTRHCRRKKLRGRFATIRRCRCPGFGRLRWLRLVIVVWELRWMPCYGSFYFSHLVSFLFLFNVKKEETSERERERVFCWFWMWKENKGCVAIYAPRKRDREMEIKSIIKKIRIVKKWNLREVWNEIVTLN